LNSDYIVTLILSTALEGVTLSTGEAYYAQLTSLRPIGLNEHKLPNSKYITRSMYQATYNVDFPPYSTTPTSLPYPQMPTNHESTSIALSQQLPSNPTHAHKDPTQAGPSSDSGPLNASFQIKVIEHSTSSQSKEKWQTVNRKRIRNLDEQEHPNAKKIAYWFGEALTTTNRFSSLMEDTTEEATAEHTDPKPPPIFISGVINIELLI
jgi:hypothetical protein